MSLNNINLQAYAFNPFGNLTQGFTNGYNMAQQNQLNKIKSQMLQQQLMQMPLQNNLREAQALNDYSKNEAAIDTAVKNGLITPDNAKILKNRLSLQDQFKQAETYNLSDPTRGMTTLAKNQLLSETGNLFPRLSVSQLGGMNNIIPNNYAQLSQQMNTSPDIIQQRKQNAQKSIEKGNIPSTTQQQIDYSTAFHTAANTITNQEIESLYNPIKRSKYHLYDIARTIDPNLNPPEGYDEYQTGLSKIKNLKSLYTKAIKGSVGKNAQQLLDKLLDPGVFSNPRQGKDRIEALVNQLDLETQTLKKNVSKPFSQEESIKNNSFKIPTFKNQAEFQNWYINLSPDKKQQIKTQLGE